MKRNAAPPKLGDTPKFLGRGFAFPTRLNRRWGRFEMVEGEDDVKEAVRIIVGTARGERVMRPEFGCGVHDLTFEAVTAQLEADIKRTVTEALNRFEARIDVERFEFKFNQLTSVLSTTLHYRVRTTNQPDNIVFPFNVREGS